MSLWIFYIIGSISGAANPPALARGVQVCNVAAILLLLVFALRCLKDREREWWLWTVALVCVNPFAVLFERKIWPPCTLPLFMVAFLAGWRSRSARGGAFCWGLFGILAAQIHMAGFFFAAAFILWTALYDRFRVAWGWWLAGNLAGAIPMLPWIYYMATVPKHPGAGLIAWWRPFSNISGRIWIMEDHSASGWNISSGAIFMISGGAWCLEGTRLTARLCCSALPLCYVCGCSPPVSSAGGKTAATGARRGITTMPSLPPHRCKPGSGSSASFSRSPASVLKDIISWLRFRL